ncbi:MAG TPA: penicillin-binding transpeptidase domain-containing protein [Thermoanaerobaculia bacterium]
MHALRLAALLLAAPLLRAAQHDCFLLQRLGEARAYVSDVRECAVASSPASTFKIPHAVIALDTGVVTDPLALVPWDGSKQDFPVWERDHSLDSAIKWSAVWFFRRTAALIGSERMKAELAKLGYARDSFEGDVRYFWVTGDLVVSPREQLRFLSALVRGTLPVERKHLDAVKEAFRMPPGAITNASGTHDFPLAWPKPLVVHAKSGNTTANAERVSWLIGYIESGRGTYLFVSRVRADGPLPATAAIDLATRMLNARAPKR